MLGKPVTEVDPQNSCGWKERDGSSKLSSDSVGCSTDTLALMYVRERGEGEKERQRGLRKVQRGLWV